MDISNRRPAVDGRKVCALDHRMEVVTVAARCWYEGGSHTAGARRRIGTITDGHIAWQRKLEIGNSAVCLEQFIVLAAAFFRRNASGQVSSS